MNLAPLTQTTPDACSSRHCTCAYSRTPGDVGGSRQHVIFFIIVSTCKGQGMGHKQEGPHLPRSAVGRAKSLARSPLFVPVQGHLIASVDKGANRAPAQQSQTRISAACTTVCRISLTAFASPRTIVDCPASPHARLVSHRPPSVQEIHLRFTSLPATRCREHRSGRDPAGANVARLTQPAEVHLRHSRCQSPSLTLRSRRGDCCRQMHAKDVRPMPQSLTHLGFSLSMWEFILCCLHHSAAPPFSP